MAKNRNRDRSKPANRTSAQLPDEQKTSQEPASGQDAQRPIPGSAEHVTKSQQKRFGHN
jgi:hypothetical protein